MRYETIHETELADITSILKNGISSTKDFLFTPSGVGYSSSLTKATKGLIMEFPVLVSKANHIESAGIVAKAYEAKFVTLLQMAFAASNITNSKEAITYLRNFHTNLKDSMSVDEFIDIMDNYFIDESTITADTYAKYRAVTEDMKRLGRCFDDDIVETALSDYKIMDNYGSLKVIKEAPTQPQDYYDMMRDRAASLGKTPDQDGKTTDFETIEHQRRNIDTAFNIQNAKDRLELDRNKNALTRQKNNSDIEKADLDMMKTSQDMITNNIISSDLKKANDLTPTMMVVNFIYSEDGSEVTERMQVVIGVKAKLYEVEPADVINKLITKNADNNFLLKIIKVTTRQISFVKDFLLAIDDAKLYALSKSRRGSTNKLFKVLERRALGGKIRRNLRLKDYCKAISSLVISQEEVEELLKNNVDVNNVNVIRPIMEQLNLISFAIIDESSESVRFLYDTGDDIYETIPLSKLEKEQKDGMSRKVINLLAKINR